MSPKTYIGVDGEGYTHGRGDRHMGDHRYVLMGASTATGKHWTVEDPNGLDTETCLDFLLRTVPSNDTLLFCYSFGYDLTKILTDLPDEKIYSLFRPDDRLHAVERHGKTIVEPGPIFWRGYRLNLQGSKFSLGYAHDRKDVVLWDIFKFYQSKFVSALKDWKVGDASLHARMQEMKDKRSDFDRLWAESPEQVTTYCLEECACMARLARALVEAHERVGLKLKSFYGAGSSASAMLGAMGIRDQIRPPPTEMQDALARAFFGGRFENSVIGQVHGTVYNYDISSAYPYQITFLPCLIHGQWERTSSETTMRAARAAFVRYSLGATPPGERFESWGPFPFRTSDGNISFPLESGGGWVGKDEYLAGEKLFPHVAFVEAWVYHCDCDCQPFSRIPAFYKERIRIGKEGPGIVLKLGYNACYGKLAQSIGGAIFSSWIWASLITSGTRAQILDLLGLHSDWSNLLMVATDGVYTRERLTPPMPRDTGTWNLPCPLPDCTCSECKWRRGSGTLKGTFYEGQTHQLTLQSLGIDPKCGLAKKPLGGWEEKVITKGVFVARPGIYFPMDPTEKELKDVRGRGVGKSVVLRNWKKIVDHWERNRLAPSLAYPHGTPCIVDNVSRFCGAKSSTTRSIRGLNADGSVEWAYGRSNGTGECAVGCRHAGCGHVPSYGQWVDRPVEMSFNPQPKRERLRNDGITLQVRKFSTHVDSAPYAKAILSEDARELFAAKEELLEQPDADFADADLAEVGA